MRAAGKLASIHAEVAACRKCPRLVDWRETIAREKVKRYASWEYWGRGVPGFGDPDGQLLIVGLAPAAHGANRTGRMFTGDRSGEWLYRALYRFGFASEPESVGRDDSLRLLNCYITATVRCAPPGNKPSRGEQEMCRSFLLAELSALRRIKVVLGLGKIGFDSAVSAWCEVHKLRFRPRPAFGHGSIFEAGPATFLGSYHPSQQNTFTGRLTSSMFDSVFRTARDLLKELPG